MAFTTLKSDGSAVDTKPIDEKKGSITPSLIMIFIIIAIVIFLARR